MGVLKTARDAIILRVLRKNEFESRILRSHFKRKYGVSVGMYSYGCFDPSRIPRGTVIGRYCSFARTAAIFNGNHGVDYMTTHPYLYNKGLGVVDVETISRTICIVEDDVWCGHNSIVLPSVRSVGRGAIVAAGAVVTKDVPRYAVVAGNPARVIKYRFSEDVIAFLENLRWWEWSKERFSTLLTECPDTFYHPVLKGFSDNS